LQEIIAFFRTIWPKNR